MMPRTIRALLLPLILGSGLWACDDGGRSRTDAGGDDPADRGGLDGAMADVEVDVEVDGSPEPEPEPDLGVDAEIDAAPADAAGPDFGPPMDEVCNGDDDDFDGLIDEDVANICGGCGGLPPEGCQAWRFNLLQDPDGTLLPFRTVGLQAQVQGTSQRQIEGASCAVARLAEAPDPDGHLGVVNIDGSQAMLNLVPTFDPARGGFSYDNSPELGRTALYLGGEVIDIRTGGGSLTGPFELSLQAPPVLEGIADEALRAVLDAARGQGDDGPLTVTWQAEPAQRRSQVRLFVGGSKPVYGASRLYRAIEYYQLAARLRDDGEVVLPPGFMGAGLPASSIWVYAMREGLRRLPVGPHAIEVVTGQRVELRESGAGEPPEGAEAPFQILAPDPNAPEFVAGEPLEVMWSPLPDGVGPLEVVLSYRDPLAGEAVQIDCTVDDPAAGALTLPAEFTAGLSPDEFAQINLRWGLTEAELPAPDGGVFSRAVSLILRLDR